MSAVFSFLENLAVFFFGFLFDLEGNELSSICKSGIFSNSKITSFQKSRSSFGNFLNFARPLRIIKINSRWLTLVELSVIYSGLFLLG